MKPYAKEDLKLYLDYLEKEMNIMGVLSAFCALTPALVLRELLQATQGSNLFAVWVTFRAFIVLGTLLLLCAAGFFYAQRSELAWYYGQISLAFLRSDGERESIQQWMDDADSWATWNRYKRALVYLVAGSFGYSLPLIGTLVGYHFPVILWIYIFSVAVTLLVWLRAERVYSSHRYEDSPLTLRRLLRNDICEMAQQGGRKRFT